MISSTWRVFGSAVALLTAAACDLSISNPGPVADEALDDASAHPAMVGGMGRSLSKALGYIAYTSAVASREIVSAGHRNPVTLGITPKQAVGVLDSDWEESNDHWKFAQQARWVAEDGARRIEEALGDDTNSSELAAQAFVHVGFANRLLGENMCAAVFDGGPEEPRVRYFERADTAFTRAIEIATAAGAGNLANAARAGRSSVRMWLGKWDEAAADAAQVPLGFVYRALYSSTEQEQFNRMFAANVTTQRAHSVFDTFFDAYFRQSGDQRTPWSTDAAFPTGTANVPWYFQTKFASRSAPINLASGREMRLIIAESQLRGGDWASALATINSLRVLSGVTPWVASDVMETWTALSRERGIELWLEGRRLGDLFRWEEEGAPGIREEMTGRDMCFPIGISELDANPNI